MIILGIDPGYARTGWGVIHHDRGKTKAIEYGCIETAAHIELSHRLLVLKEELEKILRKHKPDMAGVEELYFGTNTKTALSVGQARGVVISSLAEHKIPVHSFNPLQIKLAITGYGKADKGQVGTMIRMFLGLAQIPTPDDTADALAVALACAFTKKY